MTRRKKRKLSLFGKIIFLLLIIVIVLIIKSLFNNPDDVEIKNNYDDLNSDLISIVDTSEIDNDVIKEIFADGMSLDNLKDVLNQKENFIPSTSKYSYINYDFDRQLHYSEIEDILKNINNSKIANVEIIGRSVDGRNIYGVEVGKGKDVLYLDANIHAAEIANTLILVKFLSELTNEYENGNEQIINNLNNIKLAVLPCMNPDGYEIYNYGVESLNNKNLWWYVNKDKYDFENIKSNANGVDINRNFPTQNAGMLYNEYNLINSVSKERTTSKTAYFGGTSLGSEPETKASMYFMLKHYKNVFAYINFHSQGRVIYAGKPNLANEFNDITKEFANKISSYNKYIVHGLSSEEVGEGNDGSATDFMAELACGFSFSKQTKRLTTDKYKNNSSSLVNHYPVVTVETIKTYTRDPNYFKDEYYNYGLKDLLFSLIQSR